MSGSCCIFRPESGGEARLSTLAMPLSELTSDFLVANKPGPRDDHDSESSFYTVQGSKSVRYYQNIYDYASCQREVQMQSDPTPSLASCRTYRNMRITKGTSSFVALSHCMAGLAAKILYFGCDFGLEMPVILNHETLGAMNVSLRSVLDPSVCRKQ